MSGSRSATPRSDTFLTRLNPSSDWTISPTTLAECDMPQFAHSTQVSSLPLLSQSTPSSSTPHQMARRLRGEQASSRLVAESVTSDSQKNTAGSRKADGSSQSAASKKKRTRTLTTPYQAAVLHALLAKSRFPNAAVREEVGRSIGLSARKVQVWFQNQRQKTRRRHSQSGMSHKKPSQVGAPPSGSETSGLGSFLLVPEPSSGYLESMSRSAAMESPVIRKYHSLDPSYNWGKSSTELSGPGMPGPEPSSELTYHGLGAIPSRPDTDHEEFKQYNDLRDRPRRSPSPLRVYPPLPTPDTSILQRLYKRNHDPSRTLPPPAFFLSQNFSVPSSSSGPSNAAFDHAEMRSSSPLFSHQPPEMVGTITWSPPYVLQPQPQRPIFSFESALESSRSPSWALREHDSASRSITPSDPGRPPITANVAIENVQPAEVRPPQRPGRYDPIRDSSPPEVDHQHTEGKM